MISSSWDIIIVFIVAAAVFLEIAIVAPTISISLDYLSTFSAALFVMMMMMVAPGEHGGYELAGGKQHTQSVQSTRNLNREK
jgi:hypothetical protein